MHFNTTKQVQFKYCYGSDYNIYLFEMYLHG